MTVQEVARSHRRLFISLWAGLYVFTVSLCVAGATQVTNGKLHLPAIESLLKILCMCGLVSIIRILLHREHSVLWQWGREGASMHFSLLRDPPTWTIRWDQGNKALPAAILALSFADRLRIGAFETSLIFAMAYVNSHVRVVRFMFFGLGAVVLFRCGSLISSPSFERISFLPLALLAIAVVACAFCLHVRGQLLLIESLRTMNGAASASDVQLRTRIQALIIPVAIMMAVMASLWFIQKDIFSKTEPPDNTKSGQRRQTAKVGKSSSQNMASTGSKSAGSKSKGAFQGLPQSGQPVELNAQTNALSGSSQQDANGSENLANDFERVNNNDHGDLKSGGDGDLGSDHAAQDARDLPSGNEINRGSDPSAAGSNSTGSDSTGSNSTGSNSTGSNSTGSDKSADGQLPAAERHSEAGNKTRPASQAREFFSRPQRPKYKLDLEKHLKVLIPLGALGLLAIGAALLPRAKKAAHTQKLLRNLRKEIEDLERKLVNGLVSLDDIVRLYEHFLNDMDTLGFERHSHETPDEYLNRFSKLFPRVAQPLRNVTEAFVQTRYGAYRINAALLGLLKAELVKIYKAIAWRTDVR